MALDACGGFPDNCGVLRPDPEIAGIGVYRAFIASALLTLGAAVLRFLCRLRLHGSEPEYETELKDGWPQTRKDWHQVKSIFFNFAQRFLIILPSKYVKILDKALEPFIMSLADQQLVTGLAILIAALRNWDTIQAYHLNIVIYLAWFSCFTHTVALLSLGAELRKSWILLLVRVIFGYLTVFMFFAVEQSWSRSFGQTAGVGANQAGQFGGAEAACPARCSMHSSNDESKHSYRLILILLQYPYIIASCLPDRWADRLWEITCARWERLWGTSKLCARGQASKSRITLSFIFVLLFYAPYYALVLGLAFGIADAKRLRNTDNYPGLVTADDFEIQDTWTFAQLVAVILLALPVLAGLESLLDECQALRESRRVDHAAESDPDPEKVAKTAKVVRSKENTEAALIFKPESAFSPHRRSSLPTDLRTCQVPATFVCS